MRNLTAIEPDKDYTFSDYFKLNHEPEDMLSYFGYAMKSEALLLPKSHTDLPRLPDLRWEQFWNKLNQYGHHRDRKVKILRAITYRKISFERGKVTVANRS